MICQRHSKHSALVLEVQLQLFGRMDSVHSDLLGPNNAKQINYACAQARHEPYTIKMMIQAIVKTFILDRGMPVRANVKTMHFLLLMCATRADGIMCPIVDKPRLASKRLQLQ